MDQCSRQVDSNLLPPRPYANSGLSAERLLELMLSAVYSLFILGVHFKTKQILFLFYMTFFTGHNFAQHDNVVIKHKYNVLLKSAWVGNNKIRRLGSEGIPDIIQQYTAF